MRSLIDFIENDQIDLLETFIESRLSELAIKNFDEATPRVFNIFEQEGSATEDPKGTIEDPLLQPSDIVSKEYFFKRFPYGDHEILMKKVGMGQNAPTVTYIDGERYEVFTTSKQAEKETIRYIKDGSYAKANDAKKAKEDETAKVEQDKVEAEDQKKKEEEANHEKITESLRQITDTGRPSIFTMTNGEEMIITLSEATHALEILNLLNNQNGIKFLRRLSDSVTSYQDTMDFFLDRIRKGIY